MSGFTTSAPGRLCLFGEHQDYLGLPVIAMAIDRRCRLTWTPRTDSVVKVRSEEMGDVLEFDLVRLDSAKVSTPLEAVVGELKTETDIRPSGMDVHIRSDIPIRAGCSSSTALMTAWTSGWSKLFGMEESIAALVRRCHRAEVLSFGGAGGDMDHFACAHGGLHRFGNGGPAALPGLPGAFILGDSGEPKDTQGHLARCRDARLPLMPDLDSPPADWTHRQRALAEGTRTNRDLEAEWARRMELSEVHGPAMGQALIEHHGILRDVLDLSTPLIESMIEAALEAGAWGGKINGSGGGGCMFAYASPDRVDSIIQAIKGAGAKAAWHVSACEGVRHA